jgi:hypothetical protein
MTPRTRIPLTSESFDELFEALPPMCRWVNTSAADEGYPNIQLAGLVFIREDRRRRQWWRR